MTKRQIPPEIVSKILRTYVATNPPRLEWLPIRLTNRLFNQELLYSFFVLEAGRSPDFNKFCEPHRPWRKPRGKFVRLITSWLLQGSLLLPPTRYAIPSTQTEAIHQAAVLLQDWAEQHPTGPCQLAISSGFSWLKLSRDPSKVSSRAVEIVCNALVRHLGSYGGKEKNCRQRCRYVKQPYFGKETPIFVFFLTVCFVGDVRAIGRALKSLKAETEAAAFSLSIGSGLLVAAKEGHDNATKFLLDNGADASTCVNKTWALRAAAKSGKLSMIKTFFQPQYSIAAMFTSNAQISQDPSSLHVTRRVNMCEQAMLAAANLVDDVTREQMAKFLHNYITNDGLAEAARTDLLMKAVKFNDLRLAEWIINTGPIELYRGRDFVRSHPLAAAVTRRNMQMIRLILSLKRPTFLYGVSNPAIDAAFYVAYLCNYLEGFIELVPYIVPYEPFRTEEFLLRFAAVVEGGLEAVSKLAPYDFYARTKWGTEATVGASLIDVAVRNGRRHNLEWLLSRGFRSSQVIEIAIDAYKERSDDYRRMDKLLKSHQMPGLEIRDYLCEGDHCDEDNCHLTHVENTVHHERLVQERAERIAYGKKCRSCW